MCIWDGHPMQPEDEREQAWHEDDADEWRGGEPVNQGDEWKDPDWHDGPEYRAWKKKRDEEGKG